MAAVPVVSHVGVMNRLSPAAGSKGLGVKV